MSGSRVAVKKLPDTPWRRAAVLALVVLVHAGGIWAWMTYGGLNKTPALPPMMVTMDPPPPPAAAVAEKTAHTDPYDANAKGSGLFCKKEPKNPCIQEHSDSYGAWR